MILSDISIKRPVFSTVLSLLLIIFGLLAFQRLPLREYPDINPPVVSIQTQYYGASSQVIETKITQVIEDIVSGIDGIDTISSTSEDEFSTITITFTIDRDIDAAASDVRDRVSRVINELPDEAEPPVIAKADSNTDVIMWLSLRSEMYDDLWLTDFANRYLIDHFSTIDGVAQVRLGGRLYAMRVWLDPIAMAARGVTVADVENALRTENIEIPAGRIESSTREFPVRIERQYFDEQDFDQLIVLKDSEGRFVRLSDIAEIRIGPDTERFSLKINGQRTMGLGISKQSKANSLAVARAVKKKRLELMDQIPYGVEFEIPYDASIFIEASINEVYNTLFITIALVILVIYLFLGNLRATFIPAITIPISLISGFIVLYYLGYSINLLTLLGFVLAIGLVVDDAIVVLENIYRRIEMGEQPLVAAYLGARQVSFAVIATTVVVIAVFLPVSFIEGDVGRLFIEFAFAIMGALCFSTFVALTLCPMLCSQILSKTKHSPNSFFAKFQNWITALEGPYRRSLVYVLNKRYLVYGLTFATAILALGLFSFLPKEFQPDEDRGAVFTIMIAPEGASFDYTASYVERMEDILMPLYESGEADKILTIMPQNFNSSGSVNSALGIVLLDRWENRDRASPWIVRSLYGPFSQLPGVLAFPILPKGLGQRGFGKPIEFVIGGSQYEDIAEWRDRIVSKLRESPDFINVDWDYKETKVQMVVEVDANRAAALGVSNVDIGRSLEAFLGSRRVTTYLDRGEEHDVILQAKHPLRATPSDIESIYVRSVISGELIPLANVVTIHEKASSSQLNRYNRLRSITITSNLSPSLSQGEAIEYLEKISKELLPNEARIDFKGDAREFKKTGSKLLQAFIVSLVIVYLALAAQFESFLHPIVIMMTVPLAVTGALIGLFYFGGSLNIYSQIAVIMLIGLASKNGILVVEFINQLRDEGTSFYESIIEACIIRLRPILMTGFSTAMGALPLILAFGAGAESRQTIGVVIFFGVFISTLLTLYVVPVFYHLICKNTGSPEAIAKELEENLKGNTEA